MLRGGSERLKADFDASLTAGYSASEVASGASNAMGDFCAFAADNSNTQTKSLLAGSPAIWPREMHRLDPSADALLLPRASKVVKEMSMVGRAEQMDWYLRLLRATLGLPRHKLSAPSSDWSPHVPSKDWSKASPEERQCLAEGASVDEELYMHFCAQRRD